MIPIYLQRYLPIGIVRVVVPDQIRLEIVPNGRPYVNSFSVLLGRLGVYLDDTIWVVLFRRLSKYKNPALTPLSEVVLVREPYTLLVLLFGVFL